MKTTANPERCSVASGSAAFIFTPEQIVVRLRCFSDGAEFKQDEWQQCLFGQAADLIDRLTCDCARLDSREILLTVSGERVHHRGVDLRAAIDTGIAESSPNVKDEPQARSTPKI